MCYLLSNSRGVTFDWKLVWEGLAPNKDECFVWKLLHGQLPTKLDLQKCGCELRDNLKCGLCRDKDESINHFFQCSFAWSVKSKWCSLWGIQGVFACDGKSFLLEWVELCP
ncbi:hypothetical protein GQ457_06G008900 [Hibiscus cannabinus]